MPRLTSRALTIAIGVFLASWASATTYYVSATFGSDSNGGTSQASPWKTLGKIGNAMAAGTVKPGDSVLLLCGDSWSGTLTVSRSGLSNAPIRVSSYGEGARPHIDATGNSSGVSISGRSYVIVSRLWITDARDRGVTIFGNASNITVEDVRIERGDVGVRVSNGTLSNITLRRVVVRLTNTGISASSFTNLSDFRMESVFSEYNSARGLLIGYGTNPIQGFTMVGCKLNGNPQGGASIRRISGVSISSSDFMANGGYGLAFFSPSSDVAISGVRSWSNVGNGFQMITESASPPGKYVGVSVTASSFLRNTADGMSLRGQGDGAGFTACISSFNKNDGFNVKDSWTDVVFDVCTANSNGETGNEGDGDAFSFHNNTTGTISRCTAADNKKSAAGHVDASEVTMVNNLFTHSNYGTWPLVHLSGSGSHKVWHNTIVTKGSRNSGVRALNTVTADIRSNIIVGGEVGIQRSGATVTEGYNLIHGFTFGGWVGLSPGTGSFSADPMFEGSSDYSLKASSPAIDSAAYVGVAADKEGKPRYDWPGTANTGAGNPPYADRGCFERVPSV